LDLFGTVLVGSITAVGGGTIRDAVFLKKRAFWTDEPEYLYLCLISAGLTFMLWPKVEQWRRTCISEQSHVVKYDFVDKVEGFFDALGVGVFACIGVQNGLKAGVSSAACIVCGVSTATFGGATRDVICDRPVRIAHSATEIYASTALCGAVAYMSARAWQLNPALRIVSGVGVAMGMRGWALARDVRLPTWDDLTLKACEGVKTTVEGTGGATDVNLNVAAREELDLESECHPSNIFACTHTKAHSVPGVARAFGYRLDALFLASSAWPYTILARQCAA
jgi:uncharacterized membrane protein YeiH